jgi:tetratricopeptide (TPR) repeat protein
LEKKLFNALNITLEKQIASAARAVEEARRNAHRDPARLGELVEHINVLAELRQQEGGFAKAESLYREALFRIGDTRSPDVELTVGVYSLLAHLYEQWGKHEEAAGFYQKALDLSQKSGIRNSEKVATVKNNLALMYKGMRDLPKAVQYYEEALAEFRQLFGENSSKVASVYNNLGVLHYQNMEVEEAVEMHQRALRIRESLPTEDRELGDLSQTYANLSAAYKAMGEFQKAHECMEKVRAINAGAVSGPAPVGRRSAALILDKSA